MRTPPFAHHTPDCHSRASRNPDLKLPCSLPTPTPNEAPHLDGGLDDLLHSPFAPPPIVIPALGGTAKRSLGVVFRVAGILPVNKTSVAAGDTYVIPAKAGIQGNAKRLHIATPTSDDLVRPSSPATLPTRHPTSTSPQHCCGTLARPPCAHYAPHLSLRGGASPTWQSQPPPHPYPPLLPTRKLRPPIIVHKNTTHSTRHYQYRFRMGNTVTHSTN